MILIGFDSDLSLHPTLHLSTTHDLLGIRRSITPSCLWITLSQFAKLDTQFKFQIEFDPSDCKLLCKLTHITHGSPSSGFLLLLSLLESQGILFGSQLAPWVPSEWQEVSDRVRGGISVAHLDLINSSDRGSGGVRFHGTLDTSTLGGAGFASVAYRPHEALKLPRSQFTAIYLELSPSIPADHVRRFTLALKNEPLSRGPDGRQESTTSYEFEISLPETINSTADPQPKLDQRVSVVVPFDELQPTYRGRPKTDAPKFNSSHLTELSIMCRSYFDQQTGPFDLSIFRLGVVYQTG